VTITSQTELARSFRQVLREYRLQVKLAFFGALTPEEERRLQDAVARCPIHKLMTTATIDIVTAPLEERGQLKGDAA
jgi:uncharacterized OsmC-like protein